jgi:hypothetical protein
MIREDPATRHVSFPQLFSGLQSNVSRYAQNACTKISVAEYICIDPILLQTHEAGTENIEGLKNFPQYSNILAI